MLFPGQTCTLLDLGGLSAEVSAIHYAKLIPKGIHNGPLLSSDILCGVDLLQGVSRWLFLRLFSHLQNTGTATLHQVKCQFSPEHGLNSTR